MLISFEIKYVSRIFIIYFIYIIHVILLIKCHLHFLWIIIIIIIFRWHASDDSEPTHILTKYN